MVVVGGDTGPDISSVQSEELPEQMAPTQGTSSSHGKSVQILVVHQMCPFLDTGALLMVNLDWTAAFCAPCGAALEEYLDCSE